MHVLPGRHTVCKPLVRSAVATGHKAIAVRQIPAHTTVALGRPGTAPQAL